MGARCTIFVAAGSAAEVERLGGGFCPGGAGSIAGEGACLEDGDVPVVLPGIGGVRTGAAFFGIERERLGELVGGDPEEVRGGVAAEGDVSAEEVF